MNIKVWDDKYTIKSDARNYILFENKEKDPSKVKEGEDIEYQDTVGYFNTVGNCLRRIVDREGRNNNCRTFDGYIRHIKEVEKKLDETLEQMEKITGTGDRLMKMLTARGLVNEYNEDGEPPKTKGRKKKTK